MQIEFEKWHGCNNDFLVVWVEKRQELTLGSLIAKGSDLCSRKGGGVGADGLLLISYDSTKALVKDLALTIVNSDGSVAATCGNGIRCAAASVLKRFHKDQKAFDELEGIDLKLQERTVTIQFLSPLRANETFRVPLMAVDMGAVTVNEHLPWFVEAKTFVQDTIRTHSPHLRLQEIGACEIGNQHLVIYCEKLKNGDIYALGPALQKSPYWNGINVHLVESVAFSPKTVKVPQSLKVNTEEVLNAQVWERGSGPTQACGSGACAIAACAFASDRNERGGWITVHMPGGDLFVKQDDAEDSCTLAGPAALVFTGFFEL